MHTQLSPHHPNSRITPDDLQQFSHLVPPSGSALLRMLGQTAGLALINGWGGVSFVVPKGPCSNAGGARRWAQIVAIIGADAMFILACEMGGEGLDVPTLDTLRRERRNHAIRSQFDHMTASIRAGGEGLSKGRAVQELAIIHAPITGRTLEAILDRPTHAPDIQNTLFE